MTLAETGGESMTGGRLKHVQELAQFHASQGKIATVTTFRRVSRSGILDTVIRRRVMI